jgi:hypothetical protein
MAGAMFSKRKNIQGDGIELSFPVAPDVERIASRSPNCRLCSDRGSLEERDLRLDRDWRLAIGDRRRDLERDKRKKRTREKEGIA